MNAVEYHAGLSKFFGQFRGIATNYNQIVRLLNTHFSEKKALAYLYKLEKQTIEFVQLTKEIIRLTQEFEKKYLNKE